MTRARAPTVLTWSATLLLALVGLGADFLASNPPDLQNLDRFFAPPTKVRFIDRQGRFHWRPFVYGMRIVDPLTGTYEEDPEAVHRLYLLTPGHGYRLLGVIPCRIHLIGTQSPKVFYH